MASLAESATVVSAPSTTTGSKGTKDKKGAVNFIDRLPAVLTNTIISTYLNLSDRWTASATSRSWYIAYSWNPKPWRRAIDNLRQYQSSMLQHRQQYPSHDHHAGVQAIYDDNLFGCLNGLPPLSSPLSPSKSSSSSSPPGGAVIQSSMDISLGRGGQKMMEFCPWRYHWYGLSRCRDASLELLSAQKEHDTDVTPETKEYKLVVGGAGGSGKSAVTIRFVTS
jgi:hypothetical protein